MWRVFLRLRLFFLLFETAGLPPMPVLLQSAATLCAWLVLTFTAPEMTEGTKLALVVATALLAGPGLRAPIAWRRLRQKGFSPLSLAPIMLAVWSLVIFAPDPVWLQRLVTLGPVLMALACLIDILDGQGTFGQHWWPGEELDAARERLVRAFFLKHLAFAILNETMIAGLSPDAWLIFLAVLPVVHHFVNTGLTTTVLIDVEEHG